MTTMATKDNPNEEITPEKKNLPDEMLNLQWNGR